MGLLDKIKEAAKDVAEQSKSTEMQKKTDRAALVEYVHDHVQELNEIFVENEGELYPVKSALIFGSPRTKEEIEDILEEMDSDDEDLSFKEALMTTVPCYIDSAIGRIHIFAGEGSVNIKPKCSFDFYLKKKDRKIKEILDQTKSAQNLSSSEIIDKIKNCHVELVKEEHQQIQEAWNKCIVSLIKMMPDPSLPEILKEIKLCYTELKKDSDEQILEAWEERAYHLMDLLEMPSAENAIRTIQEYDRLKKQIAAETNISKSYSLSEAWEKKKQEVIEYAKINYMDEPAVKKFFDDAENAVNIAKKAKLYESLGYVGCVALTIIFFFVNVVLALVFLAIWIVAAVIYRKHIKSKYVKLKE